MEGADSCDISPMFAGASSDFGPRPCFDAKSDHQAVSSRMFSVDPRKTTRSNSSKLSCTCQDLSGLAGFSPTIPG